MPNWLWPQTVRVTAEPAVRLGRVLHWCGIGVAAFFLLVFADTAFGTGDPITPLIASVASLLAGRGARYLFAGE